MLPQFGKSTKAKKIGNSLFTAFAQASPPLVWKFDLEKNHSFTLSLQGEDGDWELGITSPRGEFYTVARFLARDDAEEALICAQRALFKREPRNTWRVLGPVSMILLVILILLLLPIHPARHDQVKTATSTTPTSTPTTPAPGDRFAPPDTPKEGVPLPADQVLTPPP